MRNAVAALVVVVGVAPAGCAFERPANVGQVAGTVAGLWTGSEPLQLRLRAADASEDISVAADGAFQFATAVVAGSYSVELVAQPAAHTCVVRSGASGEVGAADVPVDIGCTGPGGLRLAYPHAVDIPLDVAAPRIELSLLAGEVQLGATGALTAVELDGDALATGYRSLPIALPRTEIAFVLTAGALSRAGVLEVARGPAAPVAEVGLVGAAGDSGFGTSIAASADWLAIGAPGDGASGSVWLFQRDGDRWMPRGTLVPSTGTGNDFGAAVALSGDVLAVGEPGEGSGAGAVQMYALSGNAWSPGQRLRAGDPESGARFGAAVAVDGARLIIGEPFGGGPGAPGAAHAFVRSIGPWMSVPLPVSDDGERGAYVAVRGDLAAVCAPRHAGQGSVTRYAWSGTAWQLSGRLVGMSGEGLCHGVAIGGADPRLFVSAVGDAGAGALVVLGVAGADLVREATISSPAPVADGSFGRGTAYDGATLAIGAPGERGTAGAVHLYRETTGGWELAHTLTGDGREFGQAVGLAPGQVVVGAPAGSATPGVAHLFH